MASIDLRSASRTDPLPQFTWDARSGRYRWKATGRFVPGTAIRDALDTALAAEGRRMTALAEQLQTRAISLTRWQLEMSQAVKNTHLFSAMAAKGGRAQMSQADYGRVGAEVRKQYAYLERLSRQLKGANGFPGLPRDGRFKQRVGLYTEAGRTTYHAVEREEMRRRGKTEERNQLHPADHCTGPRSCVEQTDRQWVAIGTLLPVGRRLCRARCRCTMAYR